MRAPGDILLISCYELGHQPFHLASLLAMLRQAGYSPVAVDAAVETLSDEVIARACFVGIAVQMHTALRLGEQIAQHVRSKNPSTHICCYGLYALLNANYLLQGSAINQEATNRGATGRAPTTHLIDSAIGGEYELPLLNLVAALEQGEHDTIPGVRTRHSESAPWIQRTPFVVPDRVQLQPLERYARLQVGTELRLAGYTETTRGCKHTCLHCPITPIYQGRFFAIPLEVVLQDIRAQVAQGARHITFGDPDFWNGPTHAMRILRILHREFPSVTFDATIKIEHLLKHRHLLAETKELGCAFIVSAVESLHDSVLQHLDKGHSSADVAEAFALLEQVGIPLRPSLLPFSPWETLESYSALLDFFEQRHLIEHLDPVHLSIRLLIPPGSALLDTPDSHTWLGELDTTAYTYRWQHPDPRMDELQRSIAALVEQAQSNGADSLETFFRVKALTYAMQGRDFSIRDAIRRYGARKTLPHLTESWFC
ncbi:MAG: radical SAM protein [Ktedonobacteraceae bacterium]|nr:radical SAM protein [Ktedonobacteraceae bacterium]